MIERSDADVGDGPPVTLAAGTLTVYRAGVFRPDRFRAGTPVTVGGRQGFAATLPREVVVGGKDRESRLNPTTRRYLPALAWQYADGAWATIESDHLDKHTLPAGVQRQLAQRLTAGAPARVTVPLRVTHLPDGWKLGSAGVRDLVPGDTSVALVRYVPAATDFGALAGPLDLDAGRAAAIRISVAPVETQGPYRHPVDPPCPAGQHFCDVRIDGRYYAEVHDQSGTLSAAQLEAIAEGLEFATVTGKDTW